MTSQPETSDHCQCGCLIQIKNLQSQIEKLYAKIKEDDIQYTNLRLISQDADSTQKAALSQIRDIRRLLSTIVRLENRMKEAIWDDPGDACRWAKLMEELNCGLDYDIPKG